jgi:2-hydroxy-3-oxopropionate reductase
MATLGFIGLGIMGRPMAGHLMAAGHRLFLHSRSGVPEALTSKGGVACPSAADVAASAEIVFLMVPDTRDVEAVLFGAGGVSETLTAGKVVVDMSSISPVATKAFARRIEEQGCDYLDAPVSGGEVGARDGTLTIMVGGPEAAFDRVRPFFALMGKTVTRIGGNGDGQTAKAANQIILACTIQGVAEAFMFVARMGADASRVREALMGGFAASRVLEVHGARMLKRTFAPGFRMSLHRKDLANALAAAKAMTLTLPVTETTQQLFTASTAEGFDDLDDSALLRVLERLARYELPVYEKA